MTKCLKFINNYFFYQDYLNKDANKIINIRKKIYNSKKNILNKVLNKFRVRKYNKICYKNNAFIALGDNLNKIINSQNGKITFPHGISGIFISCNSVIGNNCTIFQQVTIGSNTLKDSKHVGAPTIGDNVFIGAGAKIIGNVKIGDNVRIGAGAIVTENIPKNSTVVAEKSKIIAYTKKEIIHL